MRIVLLSSTQFGRRCLAEGILPVAGAELAGVLTTPRFIEISYASAPVEIRTHAEFGALAQSAGAGVAVLEGKKTAAAYLEPLARWRPDLLLVLGWYYLVPRAVREAAPLGCLGIHASLLPRYRGGAPIPWAIINGEAETGVTLFHLGDGVDTGDVVGQRAFPIGPDESCAEVYDKATEASAALLRETLPLLAAGRAPRRAQDERLATYFPQRGPDDGEVDWAWDARRVHDFVRAQTRPYPGAFTRLGGERVTLWRAAPDGAAAPGSAPGTVEGPVGDGFAVACGGGTRLVVREVGTAEGDLSGAAWLAARGVAPGARLGEAEAGAA